VALFAEEEERASADDRRPARSVERPGETFRSVAGGFLVQSRDNARLTAADLKIVTKRAPTETGNRPTCCSPSPSPST
jgi:hypothetical protein